VRWSLWLLVEIPGTDDFGRSGKHPSADGSNLQAGGRLQLCCSADPRQLQPVSAGHRGLQTFRPDDAVAVVVRQARRLRALARAAERALQNRVRVTAGSADLPPTLGSMRVAFLLGSGISVDADVKKISGQVFSGKGFLRHGVGWDTCSSETGDFPNDFDRNLGYRRA
jgi:hypothetical protein